jgi:hypothetical protein
MSTSVLFSPCDRALGRQLGKIDELRARPEFPPGGATGFGQCLIGRIGVEHVYAPRFRQREDAVGGELQFDDILFTMGQEYNPPVSNKITLPLNVRVGCPSSRPRDA